MSAPITSAFRALTATTLIVAGLVITGAPLAAQSLGDVAKKEEDRRGAIRVPAKVYTNKDLPPSAGGAPIAPAATTEKAPDGDADKAKTAKVGDATKEPVKDRAYWSGQLKALEAKLDQDQAFAEAMQTHINALTADAVNRDDPIQRGKLERDRQKALADLAALNKSVEAGKKAIADLHEEARSAGVPPGWLR
jgi:hypothetical protein